MPQASATTPTQQTVEDLGRLVKSKYPGQYDDLADADVGSKVKAKFPNDYGDFADVHAAHGASGSWDVQPKDDSLYSRLDAATQNFQQNHPILSAPATLLARVGKGAVDAAKGVAAIPSAVGSPPNPEDATEMAAFAAGGQPSLAIHRLLVKPQLEEAKKAANAPTASEAIGHGLAAAIPGAGPFAAHIGERIGAGEAPEALGEGLLGYNLGSLLHEIPALNKTPLSPVERVMTERQTAALASQIKSGVGENSVNEVAQTAIPVFQKAAAELGTTLEQPLESKFPTRGANEVGKAKVRTAGEHMIDIADHSVNISQRPFDDVLRAHGDASTNRAQFGTLETPKVQSAVLDRLEAFAKENDKVNQPLADATRALAERVQENGGTFNGLNDLKVLANKKSSALFNKSLGAQLNASADVAYAWKVLGDSVRAEMYPELSRISGTDLQQAGATEAAVMDARDGLRSTYYKDVLPAHAQYMARTYLERLVDGSLFHHALMRRALNIIPSPAGEFNLLSRRVLGGEGGSQIPPMPNQVPTYFGRSPEALPPASVTGAQQDLLPTGAPNEEPLLAPPPGTSSGPAGIGESIRKVQMRADQEARRAPPPTLTGEQSNLPGANEGKPNEPFYPGKMGVHKEVGPNGEEVVHDYTNQQQLFSHYQTPRPPIRAIVVRNETLPATVTRVSPKPETEVTAIPVFRGDKTYNMPAPVRALLDNSSAVEQPHIRPPAALISEHAGSPHAVGPTGTLRLVDMGNGYSRDEVTGQIYYHEPVGETLKPPPHLKK